MSELSWIVAHGVRVRPDGELLVLEGLSALGKERAAEVVAYARKNKASILLELANPAHRPERQCLGCGKLFTPTREAVLYCQARCFNTVQGKLKAARDPP